MMTLYSGSTCPYSHRCRIVLFEKDMDFEVIDVDMPNKPEEIASISPSGKMPVLVESDLILTESNIINEYIDERFPHPQLMPPAPAMRRGAVGPRELRDRAAESRRAGAQVPRAPVQPSRLHQRADAHRKGVAQVRGRQGAEISNKPYMISGPHDRL